MAAATYGSLSCMKEAFFGVAALMFLPSGHVQLRSSCLQCAPWHLPSLLTDVAQSCFMLIDLVGVIHICAPSLAERWERISPSAQARSVQD